MLAILKFALLAAGCMHFAPLLAGLSVPRVLAWHRDLSRLDPLTRQLVWVHGAFIVLIVVAFGVITVTAGDSMLQGSPLAVGVAAFIGLFWFLRLLIQVFYFDARPWLTTRFRKVGYKTLTVFFAYFAVVYFLTAAFNLIRIWQA